MARTTLTVQVLDPDGITPTYASGDASNDHEFVNQGTCFLHVKNAGGSICNVTVQTPAEVAGVAISEILVAVPATTGDKMIGPFDPAVFNQAGGKVYVDLDQATSVTLAVFRVK